MAIVAVLDSTLQKQASEGLRDIQGTATLTDDGSLEIETGLASVIWCSACVNTNAATPGNLAAKKSGTAGSMDVVAEGASGTTTVNWMAIGYVA